MLNALYVERTVRVQTYVNVQHTFLLLVECYEIMVKESRFDEKMNRIIFQTHFTLNELYVERTVY